MERKSPFGSVVNDEDYWADNNIQEVLVDDYFRSGDALDTFPGHAADMMRLERFISWYFPDGKSEYLQEWKCRANTQEVISTTGLAKRHDFLLAFNPLSENMQKMRLELDLRGVCPWRRYHHFLGTRWTLGHCLTYRKRVETFKNGGELSDQDDLAVEKSKSCWSVEEWRSYYGEGIPPLELNSDVGKFAVEMGDTWAMGVSNAEMFDLFEQQARDIDFGAAERIRGAIP